MAPHIFRANPERLRELGGETLGLDTHKIGDRMERFIPYKVDLKKLGRETVRLWRQQAQGEARDHDAKPLLVAATELIDAIDHHDGELPISDGAVVQSEWSGWRIGRAKNTFLLNRAFYLQGVEYFPRPSIHGSGATQGEPRTAAEDLIGAMCKHGRTFAWLYFLEFDCYFEEGRAQGLPPTVVGFNENPTAYLEALASWDDLPIAEQRNNFRSAQKMVLRLNLVFKWPSGGDALVSSILAYRSLFEAHPEWTHRFALDLIRKYHPYDIARGAEDPLRVEPLLGSAALPDEDLCWGFGHTSRETHLTLLCLPPAVALAVQHQIRLLLDVHDRGHAVLISEVRAIRHHLTNLARWVVPLLLLVVLAAMYLVWR